MRAIDLGFVALTDAAPLIAARERGFFEEEGLRVTLRREVSWATMRDKIAAGLYEGAHMLAPAALALRLGAGSDAAEIIAPLALNAHGAALGLSQSLVAEMAEHPAPLSAPALADLVERRRARGAPALSFAMVFPYSMHNYMLRAWCVSAGLDPDRDLRIVVAPPTAISGRLRSGEIDGFCVGAPWGDLCAQQSGAQLVLNAAEFWPNGPDKVLALAGKWAEREPEAALALTRAVLRACVWADVPGNKVELAEMLARPDYVGASADLIARRIGGGLPHIRFARASRPWPEHSCWMLSQMLRWGQVDPGDDLDKALSVYRSDLFLRAAGDIGFTSLAEAAPLPAFGAAQGAFDRASLAHFAQSLQAGA